MVCRNPTPDSSYIFHPGCFVRVHLSKSEVSKHGTKTGTHILEILPPARLATHLSEHLWRLQVGTLPALTKGKGFLMGPGGVGGEGPTWQGMLTCSGLCGAGGLSQAFSPNSLPAAP